MSEVVEAEFPLTVPLLRSPVAPKPKPLASTMWKPNSLVVDEDVDFVLLSMRLPLS